MRKNVVIISLFVFCMISSSLTATIITVGTGKQYQKIQDAINAANTGDIVRIDPGDYHITQSSGGSTVLSTTKDITIMSLNPDDPCTVANTHIFGGFWIHATATANMKISGLTITGNYFTPKPCDGKQTDCGNDANDGQNASPIAGGGIRLLGTASPTITNCVFRGCSISAGSGGDGACPGGNGGWGGWAHGGAVYVDVGGSPIFKKCIFQDNIAQGGDGGNGCTTSPGGHGGSWVDDSDVKWELEPPGGYLPYTRYSGYGGAVFCDTGSTPKFIDCNFVNNRAIGGSCGLSDAGRDGWPHQHYRIERYGGAVYFAANSAPDFNNCSFVDNQADVNALATHRDGTATAVDTDYQAYGGAIAYEGSATPKFKNCAINGNLAHVGGAVYDESGAGQFSDCNFVDNSALLGGGFYMVDSESKIATSQISGNHATTPSAAGGGMYIVGGNAAFMDSAISDNTSTASGGGIFIDMGETTLFRNCLITGNMAGSDGGGISTMWGSNTTINNCTIADNNVSGTGGYGGGVNIDFGGNADITNSIIWNNLAQSSSQIAIGSSTATVSYSDIRGGWAGAGASNITGDPLFVSGSDYHLDQASSPCKDKGNLDANTESLHMWRGTTSTNNIPDSGKVDMGYHYLLHWKIVGDFNFDGKVDDSDEKYFNYAFYSGKSSSFPDWLNGRDFDQNGVVDIEDSNTFDLSYNPSDPASDTTPPSPNPMAFDLNAPNTPKYTTKPKAITIVAVTAIDGSGDPQYSFQRFTASGAADGNPSAWSSNPTFIDSNIKSGKTYGYKVRAQDVAGNKTDWSPMVFVTAKVERIKPNPNPMTWSVAPYAVSSTEVSMVATTATDASGVEYLFQETTGHRGATDGKWQSSPIYVDSGLTPATLYSYRVQVRDKSSNHNRTSWSLKSSIATRTADGGFLDTVRPILESPYGWVSFPRQNGGFHTMECGTALPSQTGGAVWYRFVCLDYSSVSSGWRTGDGATTWSVYVGGTHNYRWRAEAMDDSGDLYIVATGLTVWVIQ